MDSLFTQIARLLPTAAAERDAEPGTARRLLESAEARAGRDPRQARELRRAAVAYLSVLR